MNGTMESMLSLSYDDRTGRAGQLGAQHAVVLLVLPQRIDRHVALQPRLLVDGEGELTALQQRDRVGVERVGRDLDRATRFLQRIRRAATPSCGPSVTTESMLGSCASLAWMVET